MVGHATHPSGLSPFPRTGGFLAAAASLADPAVTQPEQKHAVVNGGRPGVTSSKRNVPTAHWARDGMDRSGLSVTG
jgi:hypothetical protein